MKKYNFINIPNDIVARAQPNTLMSNLLFIFLIKINFYLQTTLNNKAEE